MVDDGWVLGMMEEGCDGGGVGEGLGEGGWLGEGCSKVSEDAARGANAMLQR